MTHQTISVIFNALIRTGFTLLVVGLCLMFGLGLLSFVQDVRPPFWPIFVAGAGGVACLLAMWFDVVFGG